MIISGREEINAPFLLAVYDIGSSIQGCSE